MIELTKGVHLNKLISMFEKDERKLWKEIERDLECMCLLADNEVGATLGSSLLKIMMMVDTLWIIDLHFEQIKFSVNCKSLLILNRS